MLISVYSKGSCFHWSHAISQTQGKKAHNSINGEDALSLKHHFDHLMQLGEVQATRVMAALVDGVQAGQTNREDTVDMVYLPISMGYRNCYKRYMASLGYNVRSLPNGETVVEGEVGEEVNSANFVLLKTYFYTWKRDYPSLKVSRPVEDICQYCYAFAN